MLYVDYKKFIIDIQSELNIQLPDYDLYSAYFDDKNFISCNRKNDDISLMEISISHNEDYSKNTVMIKIPFEIFNHKTCLNYPIDNQEIMNTISKLNDYYPIFHDTEIDHLPAYLSATGFTTSIILIKSDLILTCDLENEVNYILENIFFDFTLIYKASVYHTISASTLFKKIDNKLQSNYYLNSDDYFNLSMLERIALYNIAEKLKKNITVKKQ